MSQLNKFLKLCRDAQKLLMIIDNTGVAALSYVIFVILRYSYYFQATCSFQGCSIKKNEMCNIYGSYF